MDSGAVLFSEEDVCDGSAWSLKWGTLMLYGEGLMFHYNRPMKDNPGRMHDFLDIDDIVEYREKKIDWLVSKIFWVGRKLVVIKTREGEKKYYLRNTQALFKGLKLLRHVKELRKE